MKITVVMPVKIEHEWQVLMTVCALRTLRCTTLEHYELIVAEKSGIWTERLRGELGGPDMNLAAQFVDCPKDTLSNADCNLGFDAAERGGATHIVYTGNDIFTRPGWLEALKKCWELPRCGASTLASRDLRPSWPEFDQLVSEGRILEGWYGPFMMFESRWRIDAATFPAAFGDTDLCARIYGEDLRMYRNWEVSIEHLTHSTLGASDFPIARERFLRKHRDSPLAFVKGLKDGWRL